MYVLIDHIYEYCAFGLFYASSRKPLCDFIVFLVFTYGYEPVNINPSPSRPPAPDKKRNMSGDVQPRKRKDKKRKKGDFCI